MVELSMKLEKIAERRKRKMASRTKKKAIFRQFETGPFSLVMRCAGVIAKAAEQEQVIRCP
jgi:hypothetical protein